MQLPNITFTIKDMLIRSPYHDHPLYHIGYVGSICFEHILIDPGSGLRIMPMEVASVSADIDQSTNIES